MPESRIRQAFRKRWFGVVAGATALVISYVMLMQYAYTGRIPRDVEQRVDYPLYYPERLPEGLAVDEKSYDVTNGVVVYSISGQGKQVSVTEQRKPKNISQEGFYEYSMSNRRNIETPNGLAAIGTVEAVLTSSLVTGQTWVFLRASEGVEAPQLEEITRGLRKQDFWPPFERLW